METSSAVECLELALNQLKTLQQTLKATQEALAKISANKGCDGLISTIHGPLTSGGLGLAPNQIVTMIRDQHILLLCAYRSCFSFAEATEKLNLGMEQNNMTLDDMINVLEAILEGEKEKLENPD